MFLKKLRLHNIRSYTSQVVTFQEGITLLAGDIGSGKTTLLLALEFALFGILRGKTSPQELLRHGTSEGRVELECRIQGKDIFISRGLRRRGSTISQLPGILRVDGVEEELVPTELKAKLLSLMGYPESLLSKSTNLFRYTVYTPQEQVKQILFESEDARKDIIRKIFQIDKYQTVHQNTTLYLRHLREKIAHLQGQTDDIKLLTEQQESQLQEEKILLRDFPKLESALTEKKEEVQAVEQKLQKLLLEQQQQLKEKNKLSLLTTELRHLRETLEKLSERRTNLERVLATSLSESLWKPERLEKAKNLLEKCANKRQTLLSKLGEIKGKKSLYTDMSVQHLETCPTCQQEVSATHKEAVQKKQDALLSHLAKKEQELHDVLAALREKEKKYTTTLQEEQELEKKHALFLAQKKQRAQQEKELLSLKQQEKDVLLQQEKKQQELQAQQKRVESVTVLDTKPLQKKLLALRAEQDQAQQKFTTLQTRLSMTKKTLTELQHTLEKKQLLRTRAEQLTTLRHWLQELFSPLVLTMEKRVLLRVYQEFQNYFTEWFSLLIPDQELEVRLDEEFTPLVHQQGFATALTNLSGGEKTGVALAYRLALNKVLNDYFGSLHTKGLLILDEPTDGFSSEQIDRLREVFEQIGVSQLLLVSHEPRLESVADHVVRVQKQQQVSLVEY